MSGATFGARDIARESSAWRASAAALAAFVDASLPNRRDVWGGYIARADRPTWGKVTTAPAKFRRGLDLLSPAVLARHFGARDESQVIGLHTTSVDDTSRWFGLDFDVHEDDGAPITPAHREAVNAACAWCVRALSDSCALLCEDSDGDGGRHLWVRFDAPVETPALYVWLTALAAACREATGYAPETYPKQARLPLNSHGVPQCGNWLRLPGLHHTRAHWSRFVTADGAWASGADAVATLLSWAPTPAAVIPPLSAWPQPAPRVRPDYRLPLTVPTNRAYRIERYVAKVPHGVAGTGRSNHLYRLAAFLRHDMQCSDSEALPVLFAWNGGNLPPLSDVKIRETWENAATYGHGGARAA
ncbi:TOTE conflict system archaeo-eukaryotic primase domain-containing protein [Gemmatimonas sp.]|uniref:TOTE conflict system archaeo-eukaryotic primase domain-containing protein n=1 Tax=Gemmatimonas sp. TaxID=1962908 RepID=UPI003DA6039E